MAIIFNCTYLAIFDPQFTNVGKAASNAFKLTQAIHKRLHVNADFPRDGYRAKCITNIVLAGKVDTYIKRLRGLGQVNLEGHIPPVLTNIGRTYVSGF